jgi:hypothetical protein
MKTRQNNLMHLSILVFAGILFCFTVSPAFSNLPVEVPPGYMVEEVCPNYTDNTPIAGIPGFGVAPTSIDFGRWGELYISFMSGEIIAITPRNCKVEKLAVLAPPNSMPIAVGVHPKTGELYVAHGYYIGPDFTDPDQLKSRIAILDRDTGTLTTFIGGLNSMLFDAIPVPTVGTQGFDWDRQGNIYWAQGLNTKSAWRWENCQNGGNADPRCEKFSPTDEWQSAIMTADRYGGNVSVFSPGHRSPYDVAVGEEKNGKALYLYAGDNGEGEECARVGAGGTDPEAEQTCAKELAFDVNQLITNAGIQLREEYLGYVNSPMYWDELNRVWPGKHYGWPGGFSGEPRRTHIAPLWNLDKVNRLDETGEAPRWDWWVPAGIEYINHRWGKIENPVFLASWGTRTGPYDDVGAVEMFWGRDMQDRLTLVKYIDGAIDVRMGPDSKLYVAEFKTGKIYRVWPIK